MERQGLGEDDAQPGCDAGLPVPQCRLTKVGSRNGLLLRRFDRQPGGGRAGYISALAMLGAHDGDELDYDDIAQLLPESGSAVKSDPAKLFARVVRTATANSGIFAHHGAPPRRRRTAGWSGARLELAMLVT